MLRQLCILAVLLIIPAGALEAQLVQLQGSLSAANQNGSDPAFITDPNGVVPSSAVGTIFGVLDTNASTFDFDLNVDGIFRTNLMNFGPNATPIHLHLPANGTPGGFGPVVVDLTLGATIADFVDTANGFQLSRSVSVLQQDQGNVTTHPGDSVINGALQSDDAFVLVHTDNSAINGFPFGEIRGNLTAVPEPSAFVILGIGSLLFVGRRRRS